MHLEWLSNPIYHTLSPEVLEILVSRLYLKKSNRLILEKRNFLS